MANTNTNTWDELCFGVWTRAGTGMQPDQGCCHGLHLLRTGRAMPDIREDKRQNISQTKGMRIHLTPIPTELPQQQLTSQETPRSVGAGEDVEWDEKIFGIYVQTNLRRAMSQTGVGIGVHVVHIYTPKIDPSKPTYIFANRTLGVLSLINTTERHTTRRGQTQSHEEHASQPAHDRLKDLLDPKWRQATYERTREVVKNQIEFMGRVGDQVMSGVVVSRAATYGSHMFTRLAGQVRSYFDSKAEKNSK